MRLINCPIKLGKSQRVHRMGNLGASAAKFLNNYAGARANQSLRCARCYILSECGLHAYCCHLSSWMNMGEKMWIMLNMGLERSCCARKFILCLGYVTNQICLYLCALWPEPSVSGWCILFGIDFCPNNYDQIVWIRMLICVMLNAYDIRWVISCRGMLENYPIFIDSLGVGLNELKTGFKLQTC